MVKKKTKPAVEKMFSVRLPRTLLRRMKCEAADKEITLQALVEAVLLEYFGVAQDGE